MEASQSSQDSCDSSRRNSSSVQNGSPLVDLDDYYLDMEYLNDLEIDRAAMEGAATEAEDLYSQLAQKERDLILAAELGKALLDKNEELGKKNDNLTEEYTQRIEELTQEKHELKLKLESVESEYEITVRELQNDISQLRYEYEDSQDQARQADRTRAQIVHELNQQNARLAEQLNDAVHAEEELQDQVFDLQKNLRTRRTSMHEHVHQIAILREEISLLNQRKLDCEKRIVVLTHERDSINSNYEESQDRIHMLEKQTQEQNLQITKQETEIASLQEKNSQLEERIEELSSNASDSAFDNSSISLYNELEVSSTCQSMETQDDGACGGETLIVPTRPNTRSPRPHSLQAHGSRQATLSDDEDGIECDDDVTMTAPNLSEDCLDEMKKMATLKHGTNTEDEQYKLKQEILRVYSELRGMVLDLQGRAHSGVTPEDLQMQAIKMDNLMCIIHQLRGLMEDIVSQQMDHKLAPSEEVEKIEELEVKVDCLEKELQATHDHMERLRANVQMRDLELSRKTEELMDLTTKTPEQRHQQLAIQQLTLQQKELRDIQEERDRLQDEAAGITKDEIVDQARQERNNAVVKEQAMELELAKAKLEVMGLDSQLMNAIQQKIELSQQLEQWQVDMHQLLHIQMTRRIRQEVKDEEYEARSGSPRRSPKRPRSPFRWS